MAGLKGLKKKRRVQLIVLAVVLLAGSSALIGWGMRDGINFFRAPSQIIAELQAACGTEGVLMIDHQFQAGTKVATHLDLEAQRRTP